MDLKGKKILVVTTTDNMITQFLIDHIKFLQSEGAQVECACDETDFFFKDLVDKYKFVVHKINFTRFPFTLKNIKARKKLIKLCKEQKYDLIYCHQPVGGVMGRMVGHKLHIPVVYVAHGFHFYKGGPLKNKILYGTIEKHYSRYTDVLVTMNDEDYNASQKMHAKKCVKINGIGVDMTKYKSDPNLDEVAFRKELGVDKEDFVILSIAEFIKRKNVITLIKAVESMNNPRVKLLLCGRGVLKEELERYVADHKLDDRIKFIGYRKDIPQCIQVANVLALASYHEGLPKCIMEAMAQAKPVVCSDIRGSRDLIGGEGGMLLPPTDVAGFAVAFEKLARDKSLCEKYGKRNQKFVQNYSIDKVLEQMKKIFEEL